MPSSVVDAPDLSGLIELSRDPALDLKPIILRVQTDLFLVTPTRDRAALQAFESLVTGLIPTVDDETAVIVARKLAPFVHTPQSVLARLAARGGEARATVVAAAPEIGPQVIEAAMSAGADIAPALAARAAQAGTRPDAVAEDLTEAERELAANPGVMLRGRTLARLVARGRREPALAATLLARAELPPGDLVPLWLHADKAQRHAILAAVEATAALRPCPPAPRELAARLVALSADGDIAGFVRALGEGLGLEKGFLGAAPEPSSRYDLLTLALRVVDLRDADAIYVFLTLNETVARSVERVFGLTELYRGTSRPAARDLLCAILDTALPERIAGTHEAYHGPEARIRPALERAAPRPALPGRVHRTG